MRLPNRLTLAILAAAIVAATVVYAETIGYGFHYDDYHTVRPWSGAELRAAATGNWDTYGVMVPFYRPLTALWYAARFEIFGLDAAPQHVLSIAGVVFSALMLGLFVRREGASAVASVFAAVAFAAHPSLPYAMGVWLTNQMHTLTTIVVLAALLVWQRRRDMTDASLIRRHWPIVALTVIGFGLKEDAIVLPLAIVALTWLRARLQASARGDVVSLAVGAIGVIAALVAARYLALGTLGGYSRPGLARMWTNFTAGLDHVVRQVPADRPWQLLTSVLLTSLLLAGIVAAFRRSALTGRYLLAVGLTLVLAFNLPFALVTKQEQYHLLIAGAAVALAGAVEALRALTRDRWRVAVGAIALATTMPMALVARDAVHDFEPCSAITLSTDQLAAGWYSVPVEIKQWMQRKTAACQRGAPIPALTALPIVTWGAYDEERDERGRPWRWTTGRVVMLVAADLQTVRILLRDPTPNTPVTVRMSGPGGVTPMALPAGQWQYVDVPISSPSVLPWRGRRARFTVSPTFVPAELDPKSTDTRALGVQFSR